MFAHQAGSRFVSAIFPGVRGFVGRGRFLGFAGILGFGGLLAVAGLLVPDAASSQTLLPTRVQLPAQTKENRQPSTCAAVAQSLPGATYASLQTAAVPTHQVRITFSGHSTYLIESAGGVVIATDYSGFTGSVMPNVVTMNRAHETHYTDYPDPSIKWVLPGWGPKLGTEGDKADHHLTVEDVLIRNVTTDIVRGGQRYVNQNSIFIFEVAGLCIGHLGHLHHDLTESHYADIGRLDIVMVPVDGGLTLSLGGMATVANRLRSSIILPMHVRGWATPADFITSLGEGFAHEFMTSRSLTVSLNTLPTTPTVMVPQGL